MRTSQKNSPLEELERHESSSYGLFGGKRRRKRTKHLTNDQRRQFRLLAVEWLSSVKSAIAPQRHDQLARIIDKPEIELQLEDLIELEVACFEVRDGDDLLTHVAMLADRLGKEYEVLVDRLLDNRASPGVLRERAVATVREIGSDWVRRAVNERKSYEALRTLATIAIAATVALVILVGSAPYSSVPNHVTALSLVVVLGAMGGIIRAARKLADSGSSEAAPLSDFRFLSVIAPTSGVVMALVLYMLSASGLLGGEIFPKFNAASGAEPQRGGNLLTMVPATMSDYAKVMVWSFVAGYVAGFVDTLLTGLTKKADGNSAKPAESKAKREMGDPAL